MKEDTIKHFYVDEREGCIAVREVVEGETSPGCQGDLPDVIAFWNGTSKYVNGEVEWSIEDWQREKAHKLCDSLNNIKSESTYSKEIKTMEFKKIEVTRIVVDARPDADIGSCMKEAIELAAREWRNVELRHNGKSYMVRPNDLLSAIEEESNN